MIPPVLLPWIGLGALLAVFGAGLYGYSKGSEHATAQCEIRIAKMLADAQKAKDEEAAKINEASTALENNNAKARVIYRDIVRNVDREIEKPVYRNICITEEGLTLVNAALAGIPVVAPPAMLPGLNGAAP